MRTTQSVSTNSYMEVPGKATKSRCCYKHVDNLNEQQLFVTPVLLLPSQPHFTLRVPGHNGRLTRVTLL